MTFQQPPSGTIPDALRHLFGDAATANPALKNKANSLVRNGVIEVEEEPVVQRAKRRLAPGQFTALHNAMLLNAVFSDPKQIKAIFTDRKSRLEAVDTLQCLLGKRNSALGIALANPLSGELIRVLRTEISLHEVKLPNPFSVLPQQALGGDINLLQALLCQSASIAASDSLLVAYLSGDLLRAKQLIEAEGSRASALPELVVAVERKLAEAEEFNDALESLGFFE